jgi:glycosyltransferase involved in cell wall biosynthesis
MHITALVKSHDHVCCRYRIAAFRPHLEALGHRVDIRPWSSAWFLQQLFPSFHPHLDALIIQRKLLPAWQLKLLRRRIRCLIYDFDDSVFLNSSFHPLAGKSDKRFGRFRAMVEAADVVVAGNEYLRKQAASLTEPDKVRVIPTCIDLSQYPVARHDGLKPLTLAWIGAPSTMRALERIRDLLEQLGKSLAPLKLKIICSRSMHLEKMPVDFRLWSGATEADELADADIGISWMPEDSWSAGKCGLKVLQYMAAGLPVIANSVGMHRTLVRHGETGFLANTPDDWLRAVRTLGRDAELRRAMGGAGRHRVEASYDVSRGAGDWEAIIANVEALAA